MKKSLILMLSLMVASCGDSDDEDSSSSIVGSWSFIYPSVQCTETYVFESDSTFSATSLDQIYGGTYSLSSDVNSSNRQEFTVTITNDNQQADCEGDTESDVGVVADLYIEFVTSSEMVWYRESSDGEALLTLDKN